MCVDVFSYLGSVEDLLFLFADSGFFKKSCGLSIYSSSQESRYQGEDCDTSGMEGAKNATGSLKFLSSSLISILLYLLHHFPYVNVSPICSEFLCYDRIK